MKRNIKVSVDDHYGKGSEYFCFESNGVYIEGIYLRNIPIFGTKLALFLSLIFDLIKKDKKEIFQINHYYYLDVLEYDYIQQKR